MYTFKVKNTKITIQVSDLKSIKSDILVNWTVPTLDSGDSLFMEIHREGGSSIYKECNGALASYGKLAEDNTKYIQTGEAIITSAGILPVKKLVHVVVPNYRNKQEINYKQNLLLGGINYMFALINEYSTTHSPLRKITLTPVSEQIYGTFSKEELKTFLKTVITNANTYSLREVNFVCINDEQAKEYFETLQNLFLPLSDRLYFKLFN